MLEVTRREVCGILHHQMTPSSPNAPTAKTIISLTSNLYVPFANEKRAIPWPTDPNRRLENDAEHSFQLALIGMALGKQLGLDTGRIAEYATVHDLVEVYAGDTSVWDTEGLKTKKAREAEALETIRSKFADTSLIAETIEAYEHLVDEEAKFVYALDKVLALVMIVQAEGHFWKNNNITYEKHLAKVKEVRPKVEQHPVVAEWYTELLADIDERQNELFYTPPKTAG